MIYDHEIEGFHFGRHREIASDRREFGIRNTEFGIMIIAQ